MNSKYFKNLIFVCCLILAACGQTRLVNELTAKGYDMKRDTIDIKTYEWLMYHKGYSPWYGLCEHSTELDIKISVKGYEDKDSIPFSRIKDHLALEFVLSDTSYQVESGRVFINFGGGGPFYTFKPGKVEENKVSFNKLIHQQRKKSEKNAVLFFQCIRLQKNGSSYAIPNRKYWIF